MTATEGPGVVLVQFAIEQLGFGVAVGLAVGLLGGTVLGWAHRREWMSKSFQGIGVVTLPLICAVISEHIGASMFIAAFVAGLAVQVPFREAGHHCVEFTEEWGQFLNLSVFFVFGILAARAWGGMTAALFVYAALSLTAIRMLPVSIALLRTGLSPATHVFMGWFGPRGLASIVLGLIYLEHEVHTPGMKTVQLAVTAAVLVSILVHGMTAMPGIHWYTRKLATLDRSAPEQREDGG